MLSTVLASRRWQAAGVALTFLGVAVLHRHNDGLWYPDAPLHAANGLFWWDLLAARPADVVDFAIRYYARYPIIKPAAYPPLFYLLEGLVFAVAGPSPHAAKALVLLFAIAAGGYTMAWARRWIAPGAGWAGAFLAFVPGMVLWSNAVMLNVPAVALSLATLYHFRRWLETTERRQLAIAGACLAAAVLTYYPAAVVIVPCAVWTLRERRLADLARPLAWTAAVVLLACVPLVVSLALGPVHTARHLPSPAFLARVSTWTFYWASLPALVGLPILVSGVAGLCAGLLTPRLRTEALFLASWIVALVASVSPVPATNPRYILLAAPALLLAAALGVLALLRARQLAGPGWCAAALMASLAAGGWYASRIEVPHVSGFREVAAYLRERAPRDAVLYDGAYGALFGFYVRAGDPRFERRVAAGGKLLYEAGPGETFEWSQETHAASEAEVVDLLLTRSGCRWVAVTVEPRTRSSWLDGRRLLRQALSRPEFELVRTFPTTGGHGRTVELYRVVGDLRPIAAVDLRFPSFSTRQFRQVVPISR